MSFFKKAVGVKTDAVLIREILTRGVEKIFPDAEFLRAKLLSGEKLSIYFGIDPTSPSLHIGHMVSLLKLRVFQELGHEVIILYGSFTAQIGDPTDKLTARQPLSPGQVKEHAANYKKLIGKILDLKKANVRFLDNEKWSNKLTPKDMLDLAAHFTVSQLLERDMFQERLRSGKEIHANEFLYPVFQAYDAVTMDVDIQIGGNDQTFNMLAGRTLMRKMKNKEKAVVAMKLLVDPSGKKMGKTEGNTVALSDEPADMFGKIMSWPDSMILVGFELCTLVVMSEIETMKGALERGDNPMFFKTRLAEAVVALLHGEDSAKKARDGFSKTFKEDKPDALIEVNLLGREVAAALIDKRIISSKGELRRLIREGAITNLDSNAKMGNEFLITARAGRYRIGKHRFIEIKH